MGKKSKAPEYQGATYSTGGLFGSSTTDKKGTTFNPVGWMSTTMGTVGSNINPTLQSMINNDFTKDPNFQAYQNQFNRQMAQNYDNDVLSPLANRGLMRSSGLQASTNAFNDTLADKQLALYDNYYNRQANNLANLLNTSNTLYNYLTGINAGSQGQAQAYNNYNLSKWQAEQQAQANQGSLFGQIANAYGQMTKQNSDDASQIATMAAMASDARVKKNIRKIGEKNGYNWYEFEYKDGYGLPKGKQQGVIAQEVEKINPDAVTTINGIKHVYYDKLGE